MKVSKVFMVHDCLFHSEAAAINHNDGKGKVKAYYIITTADILIEEGCQYDGTLYDTLRDARQETIDNNYLI